MPSEQIAFRNSLGLNIRGTLSVPEDTPESIPVVIFVHGVNSSRESLLIRVASRSLLTCGIASLLLDFTGHGQSEGTVSDSTISQQVDDLENAVSWIRADGRFNPIGLYGETTGATVAMRVAAADETIKALVLQTPRTDTDVSAQAKIKQPTLIVQGSADLVVRPESREIFDDLGGKKYLHIIAGAGHLLDENDDYLKEAIRVVANWFTENLRLARRIGA
jgi:alpha-beta hydrolase superfamily lysophospholipase